MELEQAIEVWWHYEEVAMHFNQLIIQYRLQLMGGFGAIGVVSGYLVGSKVEEPDVRRKLRALISTGLLMLVVAAAYLDIRYYNELLRGAVDALLELEGKYPELYLSTRIKERFPGSATLRIYIAYSLFIVPLIIFTVWSWWVVIKKAYAKTQTEI